MKRAFLDEGAFFRDVTGLLTGDEFGRVGSEDQKASAPRALVDGSDERPQVLHPAADGGGQRRRGSLAAARRSHTHDEINERRIFRSDLNW